MDTLFTLDVLAASTVKESKDGKMAIDSTDIEVIRSKIIENCYSLNEYSNVSVYRSLFVQISAQKG